VDASELDLSAADNASLATSGADDAWLAGSVNVTGTTTGCRLQVPTSAAAATISQLDRSTDGDDSTEDEQSMSHPTDA